jgi:hypothetical protein
MKLLIEAIIECAAFTITTQNVLKKYTLLEMQNERVREENIEMEMQNVMQCVN